MTWRSCSRASRMILKVMNQDVVDMAASIANKDG